jgi:hypothetical protein
VQVWLLLACTHQLDQYLYTLRQSTSSGAFDMRYKFRHTVNTPYLTVPTVLLD